MKTDFTPICRALMSDVTLFALLGGIRLRSYQVQVARSVINSVLAGKGLSFVVVFPRQSGKNELQAQIEAYLMVVFSSQAAEMVKVSPTWKPQALNAMRRLERVLKHNITSFNHWKKRAGYIYQVDRASLHFLSGSPASSIVGATASLLLECDEAQDVEFTKWDKEIAPMAASTNATRIFWGTTWTSHTLLARELRAARMAEQEDGIRRAWELTANEVGTEVPTYRKFVEGQIARLGRNNPLVRTQYFSEEIDDQGGMFPLTRRMLIQGSHPPQNVPSLGIAYAFCIDVAGQDEGASAEIEALSNPRRDSTVLTIFEVDVSTVADSLLGKPTYRVVNRLAWQGTRHTSLYGTILSLVGVWQPVKVIIDATGVGAGLADFLSKPLGSRLVAFKFSQKSKSDLGWVFISIIETGRYKEFHPMDGEMSRQLEHCQYTIVDGPGKMMRWGVPDGTREVTSGDLVHDDYVLSAALISLLDHDSWGNAVSQIVSPKDILEGMKF